MKLLAGSAAAVVLACALIAAAPKSAQGQNAADPPAPAWPQDVEQALGKAGTNRSALEQVLLHYEQGETADPVKLKAARFLIANMIGHAYKTYDRHRSAVDLQTVGAQYLIREVDLSVQAWRENPWARDIPFEVFCEYVLPYRCSQEPVESWREDCARRMREVVAAVEDPTDYDEVSRKVLAASNRWLGYDEASSPADMGYAEMRKKGAGRCEEMANMAIYGARSVSVVTATDYTPWWANRDGNHAWVVLLDQQGRGRGGLSNQAAKVYRKTFSQQKQNLAFRVDPGEPVPPWVGGRSYLDVTSQYVKTLDARVELVREPPAPRRFVYLAVYNGGRWRAVHWGEIADGHATFTETARGILGLAAYYLDGHLVPASHPFVVPAEGDRIEVLAADAGAVASLDLDALRPDQVNPDTKKVTPEARVEEDKEYVLEVWELGWTAVGAFRRSEQGALLGKLPANGLFRVLEKGLTGRARERQAYGARPFTIADGKQRFR